VGEVGACFFPERVGEPSSQMPPPTFVNFFWLSRLHESWADKDDMYDIVFFSIINENRFHTQEDNTPLGHLTSCDADKSPK
jgi:hypothetical protein